MPTALTRAASRRRAGHVLPLTHGPEVAEQVTRWVARTTRTRTTAPQEAP